MRIIRVKTCYCCPNANNEKAYCRHFGQLGSPGNSISNTIYRYIKNKTMPEWCPLEDIQGIIKKIGEPNATDSR